MKRLLYLLVVVFASKATSQSFPVKNVNDEYVITHLKESEKFKNDIIEVLKDNDGLYWFRNYTSIASFDGVNWRDYAYKAPNGKNIQLRFNEIEVTEDGTFWLATQYGMYVMDRVSRNYIRAEEIYPRLTGMPLTANCIYKGQNNFLFVSITKQGGFYILDWRSGTVKFIAIDTSSKTDVPTDGLELDVTVDRSGNYWGLTKDNKGLWCYNNSTGKISCSWKDELPVFPAKRYRGRYISGITYAERDNSLWMSYGNDKILEKVYLSTGERIFYTFSGDLTIRADTNTRSRHAVSSVKIGGDNSEWTFVAGKYLVRLNDGITKSEYLINDPDLLPFGKLSWFLFETNTSNKRTNQNDNRIWLVGNKGLSVLKKRNPLVRIVPFDTINTRIDPAEYENPESHNTIFFEKGKNNTYYLFQQDPGRPKLTYLDSNLHITKVLFNDQWKKYPAYFNQVFDQDTFYIALLKPEIEPLNFRTVVMADFRVDLKTYRTEEVKLSFPQRVRRYGSADAGGTYWLLSNGFLYSFNPLTDQLDSIYICEPSAKGFWSIELVKGYDYPTVLHKNSSTFWIAFANRQLYKINVVTRKIDKIIEPCFDKKECILPSVVTDMYVFDSTRIYLQGPFGGFLINAKNDSITDYSDVFKNTLPAIAQVGSGTYKKWIYSVTPAEIQMLNTVSGNQRSLYLNEDFKWPLSQLNSKPLINDRGEMILMSTDQKGFVVFNLDSLSTAERPGRVRFSLIKLDETELLLDSLLTKGVMTLKYSGYNSIHFRFSDYSLLGQDKVNYEYTLYNGGDTIWNRIEGEPELTFTRISPGKYKLLLRAGNGFGDYSTLVTALNISIIPPFTQTIWFIVLIIALVTAILYGIYRYRLQQVKKLQMIRNNIASDLHDDIGSTLNSISIYSEVAKQQAGKEIPALELIGSNSRKIIESMSDIVWTINPNNDSFENIIIRMRSFAHQLLKAKKVEYTFDVDEQLNTVTLPMQVRKNFYLVFKEAITNLVKYSGASRVIISLKAEGKTIFLKIRDNGIGIPNNSETQGNGLINMRRRAEEINASLQIISTNGEGTGVALTLKA